MEERVCRAIQILSSLIDEEDTCIPEEERIEYEKRVEMLSKQWWVITQKATCQLPFPREICRYGWSLLIIPPFTFQLQCIACNSKLGINENGFQVEKKTGILSNNIFTEDQKQLIILREGHNEFCKMLYCNTPAQYSEIYAPPRFYSEFSNISPSLPPPLFLFLKYLTKIAQFPNEIIPNVNYNLVRAFLSESYIRI